MDCEKFLSLTDDYINGLLSEREAEEMDEHARACPECRSELEFERSIMQTLHDIPPLAVPDDFTDNLNKRLDIEDARKKTRRRIMLSRRVAAPLAACLILAVVLVNGPFELVSDMPSDGGNIQMSDADITDSDAPSAVSGETLNPEQSAEAVQPDKTEEPASEEIVQIPSTAAPSSGNTAVKKSVVTATQKPSAAVKASAQATQKPAAVTQTPSVSSEPAVPTASANLRETVSVDVPNTEQAGTAELTDEGNTAVSLYSADDGTAAMLAAADVNTESENAFMPPLRTRRTAGLPGEPGNAEKIVASEVVDELDHSENDGMYIAVGADTVTASVDAADENTESEASSLKNQTIDKSKCRSISVDIESENEARVKEILGSYDVIEDKHSEYYMTTQDYESFIKSLKNEGISYVSTVNQDSQDKTVFLKLYAIVS